MSNSKLFNWPLSVERGFVFHILLTLVSVLKNLILIVSDVIKIGSFKGGKWNTLGVIV